MKSSNFTQNHTEITPGITFIAIQGSKHDGHDYIEQAIQSGAQKIIIEKSNPKSKSFFNNPLCLAVDSTRKIYAEMSAAQFKNPSQDLLVCAVTGTNGKTTTTYLIESILKEAGLRPAVIGTLGNRFESNVIESTHTTPDAFQLQKSFKDFKNLGAKSVAMEVSSHALEQFRTWGTKFKAAVFTNLTQDHLDYHITMENYFLSKSKLFLDYNLEIAVINTDDHWGEKLFELSKNKISKCLSFGTKNQILNISNLQISQNGIHGKFKNGIEIHSSMIGAFNAQNIAAAVGVGIGLELSAKNISNGIKNATPVPGRMEKVINTKNYLVVVDYAHTPDALEKVLSTLSQIKAKKLITVFGCGGDRDKTKRPLMAKIAEKFSDKIFITSDNPRTENASQIILDIQAGLQDSSKAIIESDRKNAIQLAIAAMKTEDILLIAGKGHENYQIIGSTKHPFDDKIVAQEIIENLC